MEKEKRAEKKWKRIIGITLSILMLISVINFNGLVNVNALTFIQKPKQGDGTLGSPYQITTAAELYWFAGLVNGTLTDGTAQNTSACATLMNDITINNNVLDNGSLMPDTSGLTSWTPIGGNSNNYYNVTKFSGVFDGGNHTISGVYFNDGTKSYVGFFGHTSGATIKNLKLEDSYVCGFKYVGGISGYNYNGSTISNCINGATVCGINSNGQAYVGGICSYNYNNSLIIKCVNTGSVSVNYYNASLETDCGGICGFNQAGTILNCWNAGKISSGDGSGGICGRNYANATIMNCYNYGAVVNGNLRYGAVVGINNSVTTLSNCYYDTSTSSALKGVGTDYSTNSSVTGKSTAEFSSGEVCYLLNSNTDDETQKWYQNIDVGTTDIYPQFSGKTVNQASGTYTNLTPVQISFKDYAPGKTWDGIAVANPTENQLTLENSSYGNVTFTWYKGSVRDDNKLESPPSVAGTYYVVASVAKTEITSAACTTSDAITITEPETIIEISGSSFQYNGQAQQPTVTVKAGSTTVDPSEYTVSYSNNTNVGTATVKIVDVPGGNYTINGTKTFTITKVTPVLTVYATPENSTSLGSSVNLFIAFFNPNNELLPGTLAIKDGETTIASNISINAYGIFYTWTNPGGGNHSITAVYTPTSWGNVTNYNGATSQVLSYIINKNSQAKLNITGKPDFMTIGDSFTLSTSGGSGTGDVTYSVPENNGVLSISGSNATIIGAGTVTVTATKAEDNNYNSTTATLDITVAKAAAPTITFNESYPNTFTYTGSALENPKEADLTITGAQYSDVSFTWYKDSISENNKLTSAPSEPGTYVVVASTSETANINAGSVSKIVTIKNEESLYGHSLSLSGNIGINLYMELAPEVFTNYPDAYMLFTLPDGSTSHVKISEATQKTINEKTYYVFSCTVNSKQMHDKISAQIIFSDTKKGTVYTYSVDDYVQQLSSSTDEEALQAKDLIETMSAYGSYSEAYFDSKGLSATEEMQTKVNAVTVDSLKSYQAVKVGSENGIDYVGSSLLLGSETSIRHYFKVEEGHNISEFLFMNPDTGKMLIPVQNGNLYYVQISDITADNLDTMYTVNVSGNTGILNIEYSALSYAYSALANNDGTATPELQNLLKVLYLYNQEADKYK